VGQAGRSSHPIMLFRLASPTVFRTAESRTFIVERESDSIARPPLHQERSGERAGGTEGEQLVEGFGVVAPGEERLHRFERQFPKPSLRRVIARVSPALLSSVEALKLF
jgi:hypothetical protein